MPKSKEQKYQEAVARNISRFRRPVEAGAGGIAPMSVASLRTMAGLRKEDDRHDTILSDYLESARARIKKAEEVKARPAPVAANPPAATTPAVKKAALFSVGKPEKSKKRPSQAPS